MNYLYVEIIDKLIPVQIVDKLRGSTKIFFLDSSNRDSAINSGLGVESIKEKSRYSYIGINPIDEVFATVKEDSPEAILKQFQKLFNKYKSFNVYEIDKKNSSNQRLVPQLFIALSYNFGEALMNIENSKNDFLNMPDFYCAVCKDFWIYDHDTKKLWFMTKSDDKNLTSDDLIKRHKNLLNSNSDSNKNETQKQNDSKTLKFNFTKDEYLKSINKIKNYIYDGHIYQVNLSQILRMQNYVNDWEIYKSIRKTNPSPFSAYFKLGEHYSILCSSPERFLYKNGIHVYTEPIKGTRPRGKNEKEDYDNLQSLKNSIKEKAENIMIVDLLRNDLGRICNYGTVLVDSLLFVEAYASVFQLISRVSGILKPELDFTDIIRNTFPGGSITGCPKKRAMEIIAELEPNRRSFYTGSLGRIAQDMSDFDLNIIIRTILKSGNQLQLSLGGGIVYDSHAAMEYKETIDKGRAIMLGLNNS
ncbi:anthranilate synthase component I family protein [Paramaledivibacter caminithermalis]|jgi:para-aminobenzoate synthetase component 1|uniref:Anthranilate synthase component 1 n=1 Tax=Paramaledivibacter caminithermalis (strain DSM 15212 / CIP 107654 / DViRD3) TaxID=1121301 RepID=A0A1M6T573_PARC5|nr:anthranilate synthase component I family protein [Paramaledivibacter caminithermalis]SHK51918.1 para-aminobenzoate synthetase component 1 [Paramaledivibacter caminithermalis DSM 15212]